MRPRHSNLPRNRDWKAAEVLRLLFICLLAVSAGSISLNAQIQTLAYVTNDSGPPGGGTVSVIDTATNSVVGIAYRGRGIKSDRYSDHTGRYPRLCREFRLELRFGDQHRNQHLNRRSHRCGN
jgi:hypothetical protein